MERKLTSVLIMAMAAALLANTGTASAESLWGTGSPDWAYGASGPSPVAFLFDTSSGNVTKTLSFGTSNWMWTSGIADNGKYLYLSHNIYDTMETTNTHDFKIAQVDRATGAVISDVSIAGYLSQTYSQVNALDFYNGKLYAVENASSRSTIRGYAIEVQLDVTGKVSGATQGAYVGGYPDSGLDYHNGQWYATSWKSEAPDVESSWIATSPDIMATAFTNIGYTSPVGFIDGMEFDQAGNLFAVSWHTNPTWVYSINTSTWGVTSLYDLDSQLPSAIVQLNGLSEVVVPEPVTMLTGFLAVSGFGWYMRKHGRKSKAQAK